MYARLRHSWIWLFVLTTMLTACVAVPTATPVPARTTMVPATATPADTPVVAPIVADERPYPLPTMAPPTPGVYPKPGDTPASEPTATGTNVPRSPAQPAFPTLKAPSADTITGQARVDAVEVLILESLPVQVHVVVSGFLNDGCTKISGVAQSRDGNRLILTVFTERDANAMCTQALVPFERTFPVDLHSIEPGEYVVEVNGVTAPLALDAAMLKTGP